MKAFVRNILRETGISLGDEWAASAERAVAALGTARPEVAELLDRVRLSFSRSAGDLTVFSHAINSAPEDAPSDIVPPTAANQLVRVLAAATLVQRFTSDERLAARASLPAVTCAALAVRMQSRSGHRAVHPDVVAAAERWLVAAGARDRNSQWPEAPKSKRRRAKGEPTEASAESGSPPHAAELAKIEKRVADLEALGGQTAVRRGLEEAEISIWLLSRPEGEPPGASGIRAARELARMTRFSSPISSARPLFLRRLGDKAHKPAAVATVRGLRGHADQLDAHDLLPLTEGEIIGKRSATELALALYDELVFLTAYRSAVTQ